MEPREDHIDVARLGGVHLHRAELCPLGREHGPYAQIWTTASNPDTGGGTFADSLTANQGDTTNVANYGQANGPGGSGARILEAYAIDSAHVGELAVIYSRPESTHDQQHGWRSSIQAAAFNAAGNVKAVSILGGRMTLNLFRSDTPQLLVTSTASDVVIYGYLTEYDDFPGGAANLVTPSVVDAGFKSRVGIRVNAESSTVPAGAYGTQVAFPATDPRLHANTWYAIEGINVQSAVFAVTIIGPDFAGQRLGIPAGSISVESSSFFLDQAIKWASGGTPQRMVPVFNSNNAASTLVQVVDAATSLSPQIDFQLVELTYPSDWNPLNATFV